MRQIELQDICEQIVDEVDGALGCALVDLETGLPLALDVKRSSLFNGTAMELLSTAGVTYFRDNLADQPSPNAPAASALPAPEFVQEIQVTTEETYNFLSIVPGEERELLILVTDRQATSLGFAWMAQRRALASVEDAQDDSAEEEPLDPQVSSTLPNPRLDATRPPQTRPPRSNAEFVNARTRGRRTIWGQR